MRIDGEWLLCDDAIVRPMMRGEILAHDGSWQAIEFLVDTGADRTPASGLAHQQLANCYAQMGRLDEARAEAAEVLRIAPHFSLEALRQSFPFKDPVVLERELDAWRKAGLK
jgi:adenylate cyclase